MQFIHHKNSTLVSECKKIKNIEFQCNTISVKYKKSVQLNEYAKDSNIPYQLYFCHVNMTISLFSL